MTTKTVNVPNISCHHCVMTIEREMGELIGVRDVKAEEASRQVTVSWDADTTDWTTIESMLTEIDYPPSA